MVLSTAMPMVIAAIVIVIISKGMPSNPIKPKIQSRSYNIGYIIPIILNFIDLNKIRQH